MSMVQDLESLVNCWAKMAKWNASPEIMLRLVIVIELMSLELEEQSKIRFPDHWEEIRGRVEEDRGS